MTLTFWLGFIIGMLFDLLVLRFALTKVGRKNMKNKNNRESIRSKYPNHFS